MNTRLARFALRRPTYVLVGLVLLAVCAAAIASLLVERAASDAWVRHTVAVQARLAQARILSLRSELSLRGFVLTGDRDDLARYRATRAEADRKFGALAAMTRDNPEQVRNVANLRASRSGHTAAVDAVVADALRGHRASAAQWFASTASRRLSNDLRGAITRIGDEEDRLLAVRDARSRTLEWRARLVLTTGLALIVLLGAGVWRERQQQLRALARANAELAEDIAKRRAAEEQLQLLATNATDAVFRIGLDGTFCYASPSTRHIFGVEPAQVVGKPLIWGVHRDDVAVLENSLKQLSDGTCERMMVEYRTRRPDGSDWRWVESSVALVRATDGTADEIIASVRDISKRKTLELALAAARERAEAAVAARSAFLANMSHEIRTPMNGVIGFTDLLLTGELSDEQRRQAELIADSGRAMMRLLNDILDLSKVDAGLMQIADEPFDLHHTLRSCGRLVLPALEQKGLGFTLEVAPDLPKTVCGDGLRLRQIVLNLVGNAAKFTPAGSVTLAAQAGAGPAGDPLLVIDVIDTGIGIPPERQAAIFEDFVQADTTTAGRFGGTGLGLSISSRLASLMDGTLTAQSEPGRGSCFTLTLPLRAVAAPARVPETPAGEDAPATTRSGCHILVAEDHDINQLLVTAMLTRLGCRVTVAPDGAQAVALVTAAQSAGTPFDLVLMDSQMPVLDGTGAARRIRAAGIDARELPIVALTANAFADDVAASLAAGMQAHLAKPVTLTQLADTLRHWLPAVPAAAAPEDLPAAGSVRDRYQVRKRATLDALDAMIRRGDFTEAELREVADQLHRLAGTAGMFGETALGDRARVLEAGLSTWPPARRRQRIVQAAKALRDAA